MASRRNESISGFPSRGSVSIDYRVPYADTDQMGVVYYAEYLVYFERLRNELLRRSAVTYKEWEARGLRLPVVQVYCRYFAPAHYDDILRITGWVASAAGVKIRIDYRVIREETLLAEGYTVHATLSAAGRPVKIPVELSRMVPDDCWRDGEDSGRGEKCSKR